ncbi:AcrR family transcriptional regulator [Agrobacterium pusense]|uniref:TetR/AcrR family transcriptional regulator n=1 Tax=Rhizobium/Agrobacterium group TaxID=227290 RepID=UPI0010CB81D9|nr:MULTISPECIES: TetR/AcrR family transcriptional regulator [Rhizobium/Agrobacterium group]MBN8931158.1 TetR family transcriptional regulator [Agrobacterium pusense]MDR6190319.1 AcrR family transcriptional regulator [Agrobacterium pusense]TKV76164.1 TetR family transcriptional regulator [Rhizobium sp. AU243]
MEQNRPKQEGWRERKRRETLQRIADSALKLFAANGYEATTLDAIAEAAGISRRTFFYYFDSKEEILAAWQKGLPEAFRAAVLAEPADQPLLDVVRNAHLKLIANFDAGQALAIDRILRSNEQLRASNQTKYLQMEQATFEALCELRPQTTQRMGLRLVAMVSVGALRLAIESWIEGQGERPLADHLKEAFASLNAELSKA